MYCKFCGAELEENITLCANCGQDNEEKPAKKKVDVRKVILAVVSGVVLLALLLGMVYYGRYGRLFRENDILYKDNYTVSDDVLSKKMDKVVAILGEDALTNEQLQVFYWMQIYNYGQYYSCDFSKPLNEQYMEGDSGKTWQQYFLETALINWHQYQALAQLAEENGYTIPEEYQKVLDELLQTAEKSAQDGGFSTVEEMLEVDFGKGVTFDSYQKFYDLFYAANLYFSHVVDNSEVTQEDLEAYYEENKDSLKTDWNVAITKETGKLVDVRHVLIKPTGGTQNADGTTTYTDDEWEACRVKAQELYDEWQKGTRDETTFGDLAYNNSTDSNKSQGGLYTDVSKGIMVEEFDSWCFDESRKHGDHGLVKTKYGYHIMFFVGAEEGWERLCRDGVLTEKADSMLVEVTEENPAEIDFKSIVLGNVNLSGS